MTNGIAKKTEKDERGTSRGTAAKPSRWGKRTSQRRELPNKGAMGGITLRNSKGNSNKKNQKKKRESIRGECTAKSLITLRSRKPRRGQTHFAKDPKHRGAQSTARERMCPRNEENEVKKEGTS